MSLWGKGADAATNKPKIYLLTRTPSIKSKMFTQPIQVGYKELVLKQLVTIMPAANQNSWSLYEDLQVHQLVLDFRKQLLQI